MSFMTMLNKRGLIIDPCGTASSILHHLLNYYLYLPSEILPTNSFE